MSFFRTLSPRYIPDLARQKGDLFILRERILQTMLLIFAVLSIPAISMASLASVQEGKPGLAILYISIYIAFSAMTMIRALPYSLRANTITFIAYLLAVSELFESGQLGETRMFLVVFVSLTAVLFDYRSVIFTMALSLLTIISAGIYASSVSDPIIPALANLNQGTPWLTSAIVFLMITTMVAGAITMIIAGLQANLIRQVELAQSLETERAALEKRVEERTNSIARRMSHLRAAAEVSRAISELSDPDEVLRRVVETVRERFDLYYVGVFLLDATRENAVLQAGSGEAGQRMVAEGHHLAIRGSSMIGWAISNRTSRIALDVGNEAVRFNNPHLPLTRSELALPIIAHDEVLGAMTIQSEKPNAFDEHDIAILESVADSLAVALENGRLYKETRQSLEEIRVLNREYLQRAWAETISSYGDLQYEYENGGPGPATSEGHTIEVPLMLRDEVVGQITLEMDRPTLSADEMTLVENLTTQTAMALENARLLHETERRAVQEQKLNELTTRFSRAVSIDEILRAAAQELGQLPSVAGVTVLLNPDPGVVSGTQGAPARESNGKNGKEKAA